MKVLAIETSCDETAVSIINAFGSIGDAEFHVEGNALYSQTAIHEQFGGVYPTMAKREHAQNLAPLIQAALAEAEMLIDNPTPLTDEEREMIQTILKREEVLAIKLGNLLERIEKPPIHAIAVTRGPGLEPALWVGLNAAKVLSIIWNVPLIPTNHLEGHLVSSLAQKIDDKSYRLQHFDFPTLALVVSGGHTELVHMADWHSYEILGATRDDAVGEAFDKVARMLELPYPGGPHITRLAANAREEELQLPVKFPRPMQNSDDYDFSFSGLKTAVMYALKEWKKEYGEELSDDAVKMFAREFEEAALDVLIAKAKKALETYGAKTLVIGGGVSASKTLRLVFGNLIKKRFPDVTLAIAESAIATDNAIMIGMAGAMRAQDAMRPEGVEHLRADGNLKLG